MYNFTAGENARAADLFRQSIRLDPTFSRAYAGLSFTHWQNAIQRWDDRDAQTRQALEAAGRSLQADTLNPAAHWAMGRALWLCGEAAEAVHALEQSVELSPNYALGHYSVAFVHSQAGDPEAAIASSDHSRLLSPCDPLLFGMLGARAMALVRLGRFEEAAEWGMRAAARPNAHVHILAIAAHCLALAGHVDEARAHAARIRRQNPRYGITQFLDTFRFDRDIQSLYRAAAKRIGLAP
jgi:tetratricopeptide (TPR) repeat protein